MRTVQMTLDEQLVRAVDQVVKEMHTTRSAFTREALQRAMDWVRTRKREEAHCKGYLRKPVKPGEFSRWEREQQWGDA
jgi:metal-responsive CopG/Arc/MetJ family transcriptional regulator